jgi:hypothetical protein
MGRKEKRGVPNQPQSIEKSGSITYSLPNFSLIIEPTKTADMIYVSSKGVCGGEGFQVRIFQRRQIVGWKNRGQRVEKGRYALDTGSLSAR